MHLYMQEYLTFYSHNLHMSGIKIKEYMKMIQQLEIYAYCSMKKQYIEEV